MTFSHDPAQLERWNSRFSAEGYLFGKEPNAFLASQRERLRPGMRALCVAKAQALAREAGVTVDHRASDIYRWDWSQARYDVVVAIFIQFASPAERAVVFAGMRESLAPGGLLILQGYRPEQLAYGTGGPPQVENLYTEALLRESFADLDILHLASHDDAVDEGPAHRGMSALIDLVARRPSP